MILDQTLLDALVATALAAGRVVREVYDGDFAVAHKGDSSPVTLADQRAEELILADLTHLLPDVPVVAEESVSAGRAPGALGARFVLVDPLDGTREFVTRNGEFTVNIAVIEDGRPVMGVVLAPVLGEIWTGWIGSGARHGRIAGEGAIDWRAIAVAAPATSGLRVLASRSHAGAETEALLGRLPVAQRIAAGSSLKFCRLAEGAADLYPRLGRTMEWDTAAGEAVLTAAGGLVADLDGRPLVYGRSVSEADAFANPAFVAASGEPVLARVLDALSTAR